MQPLRQNAKLCDSSLWHVTKVVWFSLSGGRELCPINVAFQQFCLIANHLVSVEAANDTQQQCLVFFSQNERDSSSAYGSCKSLALHCSCSV